MNWRECWRQTIISIRLHKLRSFLALFGIMWGSLSVVLLLAIGSGFYNQSQDNMRRIANGQIFFRAGLTSKPYHGKPIGQIIHIKVRDILAMKQQIPTIKLITPILSFATVNMALSYGGKHAEGTLAGVSEDYAEISQVELADNSRFFHHSDQQHARDVIVLNDQTKQVLFGNQNPIGKVVTANGIPFHVIGYEAPQKQQGGMHRQGHLSYIPYARYTQLWGDQDSSEVLLLAKSPNLVDQTKQSITQWLAQRFHYDPTDTQAIMSPDLSKIVNFFNWFFWGIKSFLIFCGALTLAVGGIGVANIMFLIVNERTPEIGLRLALGASDGSILWQFLLEALVLVFIGGLLGLAIAMAIVTTLQHLPLPEWLGYPTVSPLAMAVSFITLVIIGLAAGFFPAKKASQLPPVVALAF